jgi:hypothetical protein
MYFLASACSLPCAHKPHAQTFGTQEFEKKESVLLAKRQTKQDDKQDILDKMQECVDRLERRKGELEGVAVKKAAVIAAFNALVPEGDAFREPLAKIFHRYLLCRCALTNRGCGAQQHRVAAPRRLAAAW